MSFTTKPKTEGDLRSNALPGGSAIRALLDRKLMGLADMGGSSGMIGARWSDLVSDHIDSLVGVDIAVPGGGTHRIEQVIRLDALPQVAHLASKRSLQNPDFVLLGHANGDLTMQAADAKFSIETARSKQVSVEMLTALAEVGPAYTSLLGEWLEGGAIVPGLFFAPRSALSTYVLSGGRGITRATVKPDEVVLLAATAAELTGPIPGERARRRLAKLDQLEDGLDAELLLGLYYTRLSCAAGSSWFDMHRPLFGPQPDSGPDFDAVDREVARRLSQSRTGYDLIVSWAEDAERVRADRTAITQAANLPLANRDLREWIAADAQAAGIDPPSLNRVRRELQRWVHDQLLDEVGVITPDQGQVGRRIAQIRALVAAIVPSAREETARVVIRLADPSELASSGREQILEGE